MQYVIRTVAWCPQRRANVNTLKSQLPEAKVITDHKRDGYATFFAACRAINQHGGVLLEDDVQLCRDFDRRVQAVVVEKGRHQIINFFERPKTPLKTALVGGSNFLWMQCVYLPPGFPEKCIHHYDEFRRHRPEKWRGMATDRLIGFALTKERLKYWRIRPTLVQHLPLPSVIGPRAKNRQTHWFIDDLEIIDDRIAAESL